MAEKILIKKLDEANHHNRRLVVPLMGFPGLTMTGGNIKLAQQNYGQHYKVIKALVDRFEPDLIFPLMDLSVEANALGQFTLFPKDDAATVLKDEFDLQHLQDLRQINISLDTRLLGYVETLKLMNIGLSPKVLKGAYVTGPYTLAALIMGAEEAALATMINPSEFHLLCEFYTEKILEYTHLLIGAGAHVICILEPSAVMLGPEQFKLFSADYIKHINNSCRYTDVATVYHTCGNTSYLIDKMIESGVDAISLDSPKTGVVLPEIAGSIPDDVILIGNICSTGSILLGTKDDVKGEVTNLLKQMDPYPNYILSTGCDLPQETPLENINVFMEVGRNHRILK